MKKLPFRKWFAVSSAIAGSLFLVSIPFGSLSRFNLWRVSITGSCSEWLALKRESDKKISSGDMRRGMSSLGEAIYNMDIVKVGESFQERGIDCSQVEKEEALAKLPDIVKEINKRLDSKAAYLGPREALLWPINYAKLGDDPASGDLRYVDIGYIGWNSDHEVIAVVSNFDVKDSGPGKGIEESEDNTLFQLDCREEKSKKLCARLRELKPG